MGVITIMPNVFHDARKDAASAALLCVFFALAATEK